MVIVEPLEGLCNRMRTLNAIKDALIDLYCLAGCRKLIGSYWSSFSELAWKLRNIDRIIIDVQEK